MHTYTYIHTHTTKDIVYASIITIYLINYKIENYCPNKFSKEKINSNFLIKMSRGDENKMKCSEIGKVHYLYRYCTY